MLATAFTLFVMAHTIAFSAMIFVCYDVSDREIYFFDIRRNWNLLTYVGRIMWHIIIDDNVANLAISDLSNHTNTFDYNILCQGHHGKLILINFTIFVVLEFN